MASEKEIRKAVRKHLFECMMDEMNIDEERITNDEAKEHVSQKENFVGSHIFGEKLGDSYVVCSYGEQFPLFIYDNKEDTWYENGDQYVFEGEPVEQTEEHRSMMKPSVDMHTKPLSGMLEKLDSLKKRAGISELTHTSVTPGTKN
jgi:hypothetical protein